MSEYVTVRGEDLPDFSEATASGAVVARISPCQTGPRMQECEEVAAQPTHPWMQCFAAPKKDSSSH